MSQEFEFNETQNTSFRKLAMNLKLVSAALIIVGLMSIIVMFFDEYNNYIFFSGLTWIIMGIVFFLPIDNFLNITTTKGSDIKELMQGLKELDRGWILVLVALSLNKLVQLLEIASN